MKDSQQMSVEISNQNDMALKALSPVGIKDNNIFPVDSVADDDLLDEDFHLHLSEDENEQNENDAPSKPDDANVPQENEDDVLDKFVCNDKEPVCNGLSEKLEDKLLSDNNDSEESVKSNGAESAISEETSNDDSDKIQSDSVQKEEDEKSEQKEEDAKSEQIDEDEKIEQIEEDEKSEQKEEDAKSEQIEEDEKIEQIEEDEKSEQKEEDEKSEQKDDDEKSELKDDDDMSIQKEEDEKSVQKEEDEKKEKANADLLEDQIMDTEHLLQIVDKEQDDAEDTKDSCSSNSETLDKGEDTEIEGEKTDNADEEEIETSKADMKEDDCMEIEENSLSKDDIDSELDKEYEKIVNEKDESADASEKEDLTKTDEAKAATTEESEKEANEPISDVEAPGLDQDQDREEGGEEEASSDSAPKSSKRHLDDADLPSDPKKAKISDSESVIDFEDTPEPEPTTPKIQALNIISEFMQKKTLKKLTREDLEQICLMKMCEAICHKSEIGELRHQLGVQEQMVDMWRKEAVQLTKQARDLEIVNKRLLHEVRLKNERDKPLIPVKITRSVGLQVRSDNNAINNTAPVQKRRFSRPQPATTPTPPPKPNRFVPTKPVTPVSASNNISSVKTVTNKIVAMPIIKPGSQPVPKPKVILPKSPSSLLSKALQNATSQAAAGSSNPTNSSHAVNNSPTTPTSNASSPNVHKSLPNQTPKLTKLVEPKVIDLTDEDDKKPTPTTTTTTQSTSQGVRIVSSPVKSTNVVSSSSVVNPPRIMYVYNQLHQSLLTTDSSKIGTQKLMLKLNSNVIGQANGVIATVSNGSTLAVTTANLRTSQVQQLRLSTPVTTVRTTTATKPTVLKHPAPLPPPPITQMGIAARKPIPPKPHLSIRRSSGGIVLSWKMPYNLDNYEAIASYQLYAYQETTSAPSSDMWRKVGDVKALALPMACTLTQFADGNKYHFAVRAVDVQKRMGPFSDPEQILL